MTLYAALTTKEAASHKKNQCGACRRPDPGTYAPRQPGLAPHTPVWVHGLSTFSPQNNPFMLTLNPLPPHPIWLVQGVVRFYWGRFIIVAALGGAILSGPF